MLISIGDSGDTTTIVGLLHACHDRIRFFTDVANRLTESEALAAEEVREAATHVERYFSQALPLHVADEEQSLFPRLLERKKELAGVLDELHREHVSHEADVQNLVRLCRAVKEDPSRLADNRASLSRVIEGLQQGFLAHLHEEETTIFPVIEALPQDDQNALLTEFRARRS
jgi:iron-sulfur cluster repair protein YtfE (RIC family)